MAKVIEFYVPGSFRPKRRNAEIGSGTVVVFPRAYKFMLEVVEAEQIEDRRRYQRVGLFARLEDSIYKVLRSAERCDVEGRETLPPAVAMPSPTAL